MCIVCARVTCSVYVSGCACAQKHVYVCKSVIHMWVSLSSHVVSHVKLSKEVPKISDPVKERLRHDAD